MSNASFSKHNPALQVAWDATSLDAFMQDPASYRLKHIEGWREAIPPSPLVWGKIYHAALEERDKALALGESREYALELAVDYAWREAEAGEDGYTLDEIAELSPRKGDATRRTTANLIRSIVWYDERFDPEDDPAQTLVLPDGTPAVELSFRVPLDITTPYGEPYILCGHLDGAVVMDDTVYIRERKHTTGSLGSFYAKKFTPNTQISTYSLVSRIVLPEPANGVMVEAAQLGVNFTRFDRFFANRTARQNDEWLADLQFWIKQAEACAEAGHWPINQSTQMMYGGTAMRPILAKDPSVRERHLDMEMKQSEPWDPMKVRT